MFEEQDNQYIKGALAAMMFVTEEPVTVMTFAGMLGVSAETVQNCLLELQREYQEQDLGIQLYEVAGGWRLATHPKYHELIERYVVSWDKRKLSQAALEVLAIIAYCQPVTRNAISSIRGVNSDSSVNSLLEKGYVREAGFLDAPGNPAVYGTSKTFLERFGLRSVEDLPDLESFAPDKETQDLIFDRLNIVRDNHSDVQLTDEDALFEGEHDSEGTLGSMMSGKEWGTDGQYGEGEQLSLKDAQIRVEDGEGTAVPQNLAVIQSLTSAQDSVSSFNLASSQDSELSQSPASPQNLTEVMQQMLDEALSSSIGVVDKIDFDELVFDEDE